MNKKHYRKKTRHWTHYKDERKYHLLVLAVVLLGILLRSQLTALMMNDEIIYTAASLQQAGVFGGVDVNNAHPPLAKFIFGLTCLFHECQHPFFFLYGMGFPLAMPYDVLANGIRDVIPPMRLVSLIFSIGLGAVIYGYSKKWFGRPAAFAALFMAMVSPNLLLYSNVVMLESIFLFFFTSAYFFYLGTYRQKRTPKNALILLGLVLATLASRQFLPFVLFPLILLAEFPAWKQGKRDFKLLWLMTLSVLAFFILYPPDVFVTAARGFLTVGKSAGSLHLELLSTLVARLDVLLVAGLLAAGWLNRRKMVEIQKRLALAAGVLLAAFTLLPAEYSIFRYSLALFPILIVLSASGLAPLWKKRKPVVGVLAAVLLLQVAWAFPYFETFTPVPGLPAANIERIPQLGVHAFLKTVPQASMITNDVYALPYAFEARVPYLLQLTTVDNAPKSKVTGDPCKNVAAMKARLLEKKLDYFVFRKTEVAYLLRCPKLEPALKTFPAAYSDAYYTVFDIRPRG